MRKSKVEYKFCEFLDRWEVQLEDLVRRKEEEEDEVVIARVTCHVKAYYTAKWAAAREDVVAFYAPPWASPLEASLMWVTGWKPSSIFRLLTSVAVSDPQAAALHHLLSRVRADEERLDRELERHHVALADRRVLDLSRRPDGGPLVVGGMVGVLERLMKAADCVRLKAVKGVLDRLTPPQCVRFLRALSMLLLHIRHFRPSSSS